MLGIHRIHAVLLVALIAGLAGCATDDTPTSSGGGSSSGKTVKADPSLSVDIQEIFDRRGCTNGSCHGVTAEGGVDLRAGNAYGELVNVLSSQPPLYLVRPGHALDSSYLIDVLDGSAPAPADRMPEGDLPLDSVDMQNIINWIHLGAKDN